MIDKLSKKVSLYHLSTFWLCLGWKLFIHIILVTYKANPSWKRVNTLSILSVVYVHQVKPLHKLEMEPSSEFTFKVLKINLVLSPPRDTSYLVFEEPSTGTTLFPFESLTGGSFIYVPQGGLLFLLIYKADPCFLWPWGGSRILYIFREADPLCCSYSLEGDDFFLEALVMS